MTAARGKPRPDHIAELTRDCALPLDPIADELLGVILETISRAWDELRAGGAAVLRSGDEAEVNALLEPRLNHLRELSPLWGGLVSSIVRGRESMNYNGARLEPRPDLTLLLTRRNSNFPLTIECKIIDHANKKDVGLYCTKGLARFIDGEYAWANREAIMLAYVRDGSTVPSKLSPHLAKKGRAQPDPFLTIAMPALRVDIHPVAHFTAHSRAFRYLQNCNGTNPGDISLSHLWLTA